MSSLAAMDVEELRRRVREFYDRPVVVTKTDGQRVMGLCTGLDGRRVKRWWFLHRTVITGLSISTMSMGGDGGRLDFGFTVPVDQVADLSLKE